MNREEEKLEIKHVVFNAIHETYSFVDQYGRIWENHYSQKSEAWFWEVVKIFPKTRSEAMEGITK